MPRTTTAHTTRNGNESRIVPAHPGGITQAQYDYLIDLLSSKNLWASTRWFDNYNAMDADEYEHMLTGYKLELAKTTKTHASKLIDALRALPYAEREHRTTEQHAAQTWRTSMMVNNDAWCMVSGDPDGDNFRMVPRGSYALHTPQDSHVNDITFYSVWISDDGSRWSVKQYVSDNLMRLQRSAQTMILDKIAADPNAAATLYGHEKCRCGICHRKLTNDVSRERGIGPVCAERWGW